MITQKQFHEHAFTLIWCIVLAILLVVVCAVAQAGDLPRHRVINAIIGEAEGESAQGKLAVACAIMNRGTLKGVYGEKSPRVLNRKYSDKVLRDAVKAYELSQDATNCSFIDGATHWEGTSFKKPKWAMAMKITAVIGKQVFYRERYESEEPDLVDYHVAGIGK